MEVESFSSKETEKLGISFASKLKGKETVLFYGNLGAGKTTFIRGVTIGLGVKDPRIVASPTFNILNIYKGKFYIYHWDMYRVTSEEELYDLGFFDYIGTGITLVEWSENIEKFLPKNENTVKINITYAETEKRIFNFENINNLKS